MKEFIDKEISSLEDNNVDYFLDYITSNEFYICILDDKDIYKNVSIYDIPKHIEQSVEAINFYEGGTGIVVYKERDYISNIYSYTYGKTAMPYSLKELINTFQESDIGIEYCYNIFDSVFISREAIERRYEAINNN